MHSRFWAITGSIVLNTVVVSPLAAQIPALPIPLPNLTQQTDTSETQVVTTSIRLDGRRLFQIAAPRATLQQRVDEIEQRLQTISQDYFQSDSDELQVVAKPAEENKLPVIYVNEQPLLTVTDLDAQVQQEDDPFSLAKRLAQSLEQNLRRAKQERQPETLQRQGAIAAGIFLGVVVTSWGIRRWYWRLKQQPVTFATPQATNPVTTQLTRQRHRNIEEVQQRLFQLTQSFVWGGGTLVILGLFPFTRIVQTWIFTALTIPFTLVIVGLGTYVVIRLSYILIDQFTAAFASNALLTSEDALRLQMRVSTISGVTKSIATLSGVIIGALIALTALGVNIAPILAGAGLIGVAVSLASQNLIKDAINGFLIIVEDQYALGDVIAVGEVGGLVENLNLRITQLRDAEGRLITIPNSEIKIVANLSSRWSRADLNIPVAYHADIDQVLKLINQVGVEMTQDIRWMEHILETPQVLGVENFGDRGLVVRVWIKTQPLKQWDIAREYRRRLKIVFDKEGIPIPFPQQTIWLQDSQFQSILDNDKKIKNEGNRRLG
ncbi:mechanosensitive ion channel family protein [Gloeocapsopsis dulcis]|uniref:Mechanosensitive ion channel protein MscS n=1 Tax=Gloeocapsopsis dulcis AAB1 = 1H9 TaxID=1433147 RepID=A0A6N8FSE4_9CHRO|nr:mechanosensitive ion channel family protein [Gloeocapsopsis dulcis]MUL35871.1 mechanosensitive ion channel protein MscS [Gloeocapsopsis dulcis AAB1 = 1H9]WNN87661.1 mechanosensitive ion channel family protein [Gloeocapsopsis dulcis]